MVYYCSTTYWYSMIHVGIVRICSEFSMVDESFRKRQDRTCAFRSDPKRAVSENSPHTAFQSDQNTLDSRFPFIIVVTIKLFAMMYCIIYYIYIYRLVDIHILGECTGDGIDSILSPKGSVDIRWPWHHWGEAGEATFCLDRCSCHLA